MSVYNRIGFIVPYFNSSNSTEMGNQHLGVSYTNIILPFDVHLSNKQ